MGKKENREKTSLFEVVQRIQPTGLMMMITMIMRERVQVKMSECLIDEREREREMERALHIRSIFGT